MSFKNQHNELQETECFHIDAAEELTSNDELDDCILQNAAELVIVLCRFIIVRNPFHIIHCHLDAVLM